MEQSLFWALVLRTWGIFINPRPTTASTTTQQTFMKLGRIAGVA
jgi:hypothetical protein